MNSKAKTPSRPAPASLPKRSMAEMARLMHQRSGGIAKGKPPAKGK
jgi:hypothetical protein